MKLNRYLVICIWILSLFLISCAKHYSDQISALPLSANETKTNRVSATVEDWRNSGVVVEPGQRYEISANGKWRAYGTCNFTGPDGIGLYNMLCPSLPLFPAIVEGYSHSTLIGKIGENGTPFPVGAHYELNADSQGVLYLRINDAIGSNHDNEGYVDVQVSRKPSSVTYSQQHTVMTPAEHGVSPVNNDTGQLDLSSANLKRVALVIGNGNYGFGALKNPVNDAKAMKEALSHLGFEVISVLDASLEQMETAVDRFGRKLQQGNQVGLFFYAGHGVQMDGENYLIPVDAVINRQSDVRYKALNVGQVLGAMGEARDNLNIVILDACRDNPLPRSFRSGGRGLARLESPKGTIIGFATSPGATAADGEGENGVYTKNLLAHLNEPGLPIEQFFKRVLQGVDAETNGRQTPWTESSFTGNFSFSPR